MKPLKFFAGISQDLFFETAFLLFFLFIFEDLPTWDGFILH
jgi:hypothetical protein